MGCSCEGVDCQTIGRVTQIEVNVSSKTSWSHFRGDKSVILRRNEQSRVF